MDVLNDWVGCLGGHPQSLTPNVDGLAKTGAIISHAHCAAPARNSSGTAICWLVSANDRPADGGRQNARRIFS
jgi:hypothetical protein